MKNKNTYRFHAYYLKAISFLLLTVFVFIGLSNQRNSYRIRQSKIAFEKLKQNSDDLLLFEEDELDERAEDSLDSDLELFPALLTDQFCFSFQIIPFNWRVAVFRQYNALQLGNIYLTIRNLRI